ncbi:hypothetical protein [Halobacillus sp. A5]|uniref:hypothetical protein n=1 Tax=Halobacillus sp. A5 TaxID=2880263 RepID=UPI0020A67CBB|nr:hypothetical protein [Halobacillus sp. A5]MCP3026825.1 hypothetical protein [Halobacillus sp. A5]
MKHSRLEVVCWSIAFPGFGQLLNQQLLKGIFFILLEVVINLYSSFNMAILFSFRGEIAQSIEAADYQWLMFYPCVYMFAVWDAYKNADDEVPRLSFLPFFCSALTVTIGLIYSADNVFGFLIGPIWLPILCVIPGTALGLLLRSILLRI